MVVPSQRLSPTVILEVLDLDDAAIIEEVLSAILEANPRDQSDQIVASNLIDTTDIEL